jgi:uncharacterized membrane protein
VPVTRERALIAARMRTMVSLAAGVVAGAAFSTVVDLPIALLLGWVVIALVYLLWVWLAIRGDDADEIARHAAAIDPDRVTTDSLLLVSAVASLVAVGFVLVRATGDTGAMEYAQVGLALVAVVLSWAMVHTVFMLRYARLYYATSRACIDFAGSERPTYGDFAYFAFTVGMTYQVSDTALHGTVVRRTVLRHALMAYVFGTGILASAVSLVTSLASR